MYPILVDQYECISREILSGRFEIEISDDKTKAVLTWTPTFQMLTDDNPFYLAVEVSSFIEKEYESEFLLDNHRYIYEKGSECEAYGVDFYFCDEEFNRIEKPNEWQLMNNNIKKVLLNALVKEYANAS